MIPKELMAELEYTKPKHRYIVDAVRSRLTMSERKMSERYKQMARNEELFQAYIPETDNDAIRRDLRDNSGLPQYRTIEIPHSYAILLTAHTYYTSVFLSRAPIFQLAARHGETEMSVQSLEAVLDYQRVVGEFMIPLFIWLLDPGKYGFGVVGHYWDVQTTRVRTMEEQPVTWLGVPIPGRKPNIVPKIVDIPTYQGNRLYNCRPQDFFPDTRYPVRYFQQGEFCGRYVENSWFSIMAGAREGRYFNIETLKRMRRNRDTYQGSTLSRDTGSSHVTTLPDETSNTSLDIPIPSGIIKSYELYVKLVPTEWRLGDGDREEMWVFTISTNGVLYGAQPLGEFHGKFPFDVMEHEPEGYSMFSRSMLETSKPLNDVITWLINTHFYNVRAALNNQFVVDPTMMVMKDVENPGPGKILRIKPAAFGKDIRSYLQQLQVTDVTRGHMADVGLMADFIQRITGVNEPMMGSLGGNKSHTTATAVRTSTTFGINRMKTNCEYYSAMGWSPMVQKLVQRTQQFMDKAVELRVIGDLVQFAGPRTVEVDPQAIAGFYDYVPVDGTLPIDRFAQANLWQQIMGQMRNYPQIMQTYDVAKIFGWVAGLAGIKNIAQFKVVPDQTALTGAQAGNVIPMNQSAMAPRANLNEPKQVPNMGATG